jgi:hypothetical protein
MRRGEAVRASWSECYYQLETATISIGLGDPLRSVASMPKRRSA